MNENESTAITVSGREFTATAYRSPLGQRFYILNGARNAYYLATLAYTGDAHTYKVLGGRSMYELRIDGNAVRLTDAGGRLEEVRA